MLKNFSKITCVLLLILGAAWLNAASPAHDFNTKTFQKEVESGSLTVTQTSSTTAYMSWSLSGTAPYQVTVRDLTATTTLTTFSTYYSTATIGSLIVGHTYRFEVSNNTETLILEIVVHG